MCAWATEWYDLRPFAAGTQRAAKGARVDDKEAAEQFAKTALKQK